MKRFVNRMMLVAVLCAGSASFALDGSNKDAAYSLDGSNKDAAYFLEGLWAQFLSFVGA